MMAARTTAKGLTRKVGARKPAKAAGRAPKAATWLRVSYTPGTRTWTVNGASGKHGEMARVLMKWGFTHATASCILEVVKSRAEGLGD